MLPGARGVTPTLAPAPVAPHLGVALLHAAVKAQRTGQRAVAQAQQPAPTLGHLLGAVTRGVSRTVAPAAHSVARAEQRLTPLQKLTLQAQGENSQAWQRFQEQGAHELQREAQQRGASGSGGALDLGFVNLTPIATWAANAGQNLGIGQALGGLPGKLVNEAIDLPGQSFLSGAIAGHATRRAVQGHPEELGALGSSVLSQAMHPVRSFEQAPLSTALLLAGGENALGRLGGAVGRIGERTDAAGNVLKEGLIPAFSKQRPDLQLYKDIAKEQQYNADPLRKALQVGYEKALPHLPGEFAQQDPFVAEGWRLKHNLIGGVVHPGRVDYNAASMEAGRRTVVKNSVVPKAEGLKPALHEATGFFVDRTLRSPETAVADATKRIEALKAVQPSLRKAERGQNAAEIEQLEKVRDASPELLHEAAASAEQAIRHQRPLTAAEVAYGSLRPEQVRAQLHPYAIAHMGARPFSAEDHAALEQAALGAERQVAARLQHLEPGTAEHAVAARELAQARAHRWEVSGRGAPEDQAAHEQAVAEHAESKRAVTELQEGVRRAENARSRLVGAHGRPRPQQDVRAAEGGGRAMDAADARLQGAREALRAGVARQHELKDAIPARPEQSAGLRTAEGKHLPSEEIEAHMLAHGVPADENGRPLVGFISHQPQGTKGSGSYYRSLLRQPSLHRHVRTGAAYAKGLADHSFESLVGQLAHQASRVAQHEGYNALVHDYVIGHYGDQAAAERAAENFNHPESAETGADVAQQLGRMVPIDKGTGQILERNMAPVPRDIHGELERLGLAEHTPVQTEQAGKYGLVPKRIIDRLNKHQEAASARGGAKRFFQAYTQAFRHVKFATSPKHALGIMEESAIRPLTEGAGLQSWRLGRATLRQVAHLAETDAHGTLFDLGPEGARFRRLQGELSGRGLIGSMKSQDIVRKAGKWDETSALAAKAELHSHSLPMRGWIRWRNFTERGLEQVAHQSRVAVFGKVLKDSGFVDSAHSFLKLQDEAQRELIAGKMTPNKANLIARKLDDAAGNWNNLTPAVKAAVSTVTPFGLWWLNSMRWLYRLPVTHPIKTAIAASLYQATRQQRNAEGQGYDAPGVGSKGHPNYLQGTIRANLPIIGHVLVDLGHYSPLGVAGPEAPTTFGEQVAPQAEGVFAALRGVSPLTNEKLTQPSGAELTAPQKFLNAIGETVAGPTVGATQAQQVIQGGGKPLGTANLITDLLSVVGGPSQVKPGSKVPIEQTLLKLLNPVKTYKDKNAPAATAPARDEPSTVAARREARLQRRVERAERRAGG